MDRTNGGQNKPKCFLAHNILNKLSVIIGSCEIVLESLKGEKPCEPPVERRVAVVREMAWELVNEVRERGCELDRAARTALLSTLCGEVQSTNAGVIRAIDAEADPSKANGKSDQRFVAGRGVPRAYPAKRIRH